MSTFRVYLFILLFSGLMGASAFAEMTSAKLDRLNRQMEVYKLPSESGGKIIPEVSFKQLPFEKFVEFMKTHDVAILASSDIQSSRINIHLRNLSIHRVLDFVVNQQGGHWMRMKDGRVLVFRSPSELNASFQMDFAKMMELQAQIREEKRSLVQKQTRSMRNELGKIVVDEFSVTEVCLREIIDRLSEKTLVLKLGEHGNGINIIPLVNLKTFTDIHSYNFEKQSFREILDKICGDFGLEWAYIQGGAITLKQT